MRSIILTSFAVLAVTTGVVAAPSPAAAGPKATYSLFKDTKCTKATTPPKVVFSNPAGVCQNLPLAASYELVFNKQASEGCGAALYTGANCTGTTIVASNTSGSCEAVGSSKKDTVASATFGCG